MKKPLLAGTIAAALFAPLAHAQCSVTLYGLIDAGLMYTNNAGGASQWRATSGTINGSRFGLRGVEDLGGGIKALFLLENGFNANNGTLGQDGKIFGRHAYMGLSGNGYGTLTLGRQYDTMVDFVAPLAASAGDFGDTDFAHPFDNDNLNHSLRIDNAVKYTSDHYAGVKFGALYGFSNAANFADNRAYSLAASYGNGPLKLAGAYLQIVGSKGTTGASPGAVDAVEAKGLSQGGWLTGSKRMRSYGGGVNYTLGSAVVGFVYTRSRYDDSGSFGSTGEICFDNYEANLRYAITPAFGVGGAYVYTGGHVSAPDSRHDAAPAWQQVDLQAVYKLSRVTDIYTEAMYQHASGRGYRAFINGSGGASGTPNQIVCTVGMRTRF
ncbi:porin [Burkholderia thailandensis]|uniref:Gram-negative porin family protein n=1 Tax=Burkholderia thailandensis TaxID=57975 RepID=A0AAW9CNA7_BURTH|nr:porin [Burkholderia thailandensis]AHI68366.1 gram-negative porin family protein [Burkholderia thailandensis H0587]AOJ52767.1 porin [Burkholderia thailandensis]AVR29135.1 porin [Burkholderia thailandensis]MCS3394673.1 porin [Burkholderia thailandensis]MCS6429050.1 porin [Burkholderia thailandensis]